MTATVLAAAATHGSRHRIHGLGGIAVAALRCRWTWLTGAIAIGAVVPRLPASPRLRPGTTPGIGG